MTDNCKKEHFKFIPLFINTDHLSFNTDMLGTPMTDFTETASSTAMSMNQLGTANCSINRQRCVYDET